MKITLDKANKLYIKNKINLKSNKKLSYKELLVSKIKDDDKQEDIKDFKYNQNKKDKFPIKTKETIHVINESKNNTLGREIVKPHQNINNSGPFKNKTSLHISVEKPSNLKYLNKNITDNSHIKSSYEKKQNVIRNITNNSKFDSNIRIKKEINSSVEPLNIDDTNKQIFKLILDKIKLIESNQNFIIQNIKKSKENHAIIKNGSVTNDKINIKDKVKKGKSIKLRNKNLDNDSVSVLFDKKNKNTEKLNFIEKKNVEQDTLKVKINHHPNKLKKIKNRSNIIIKVEKGIHISRKKNKMRQFNNIKK